MENVVIILGWLKFPKERIADFESRQNMVTEASAVFTYLIEWTLTFN